MYCQSCGTQLAQGLSYCNRCGAKLSPVKDQGESRHPDKTINSLVWAIVATTIIVLGMGLGALVLMNDGGINEGLGRVFVILCFLTLPVVLGLLVWQLVRANKKVKETDGDIEVEESRTAELDAAPARALSGPAEPLPRVTEQTTRAFEPLYRDGERR